MVVAAAATGPTTTAGPQKFNVLKIFRNCFERLLNSNNLEAKFRRRSVGDNIRQHCTVDGLLCVVWLVDWVVGWLAGGLVGGL